MLFMWDTHHLVYDGTSMRLFLTQISDAYAGKQILPESPTFFEAAARGDLPKDSEIYQKAADFFRSRFEGLEYDSGLIPDISAGKAPRGAFTTQFTAPKGINTETVEVFTGKHHIRKNALFTGAFAYTLAGFNGADDSFFVTAHNGRHGDDVAGIMGMFVKSLPLHFTVKEGDTVEDYLRRVEADFYATMEHDRIVFGDLVRDYGVNIDVSFIYQSSRLSELMLEGHPVLPEEIPQSDCQTKMFCALKKISGGYRLTVQYRTDLYTEKFIESFADAYFTVLNGLMTCERMDQIPLVSGKSRQFINDFNRTERDGVRDSSVTPVLEEMIRKYPDKTMLVYKDRTYTFAQFDRLSRNLAACISGKGLEKDDFAAVLTPRDDRMVIAAWGAIRAGAGFQPLDPTYPQERLEFMVSDSKARLLIADRELISLLPDYKGEILYTDEIPSLPDAPDFHADISPEGALTLIYTSGTTGKPKGCILENRNLAAFCRNHHEIMGMDENTRY